MSIINIDCTLHKAEMHAAIDDIADGRAQEGVDRLHAAALTFPALDGADFTYKALKLYKAGPKYAHKMVDALPDEVYQGWIRITALVLLWPVILLVRLVRMGRL